MLDLKRPAAMADKDDRWTIPIGGGKIFSIAGQPMNAQVQAFYNVEQPGLGPSSCSAFSSSSCSRNDAGPEVEE